MSVLNAFSRNNDNGIDRRRSFRITAQGREKVATFTGTPHFVILAALETDGSMSMDELKSRTHLSGERIERELSRLVKGGYITQGQSQEYQE